jgi:hypothetical protein
MKREERNSPNEAVFSPLPLRITTETPLLILQLSGSIFVRTLNAKFPQLCILEEDVVHRGNGNNKAWDAIGKSAFQDIIPEEAEEGTGYQGGKMEPAASR